MAQNVCGLWNMVFSCKESPCSTTIFAKSRSTKNVWNGYFVTQGHESFFYEWSLILTKHRGTNLCVLDCYTGEIPMYDEIPMKYQCTM